MHKHILSCKRAPRRCTICILQSQRPAATNCQLQCRDGPTSRTMPYYGNPTNVDDNLSVVQDRTSTELISGNKQCKGDYQPCNEIRTGSNLSVPQERMDTRHFSPKTKISDCQMLHVRGAFPKRDETTTSTNRVVQLLQRPHKPNMDSYTAKRILETEPTSNQYQ